MPLLFNEKTGRLEETTEQQGYEYPIVSPEGELGSAPAETYHQLIEQGFSPAKPEQLQEYARKQKFTTPTQTAVAGAEAFARGATFGLSTAAERALGVDPEGIRAREEYNPVTSTVSEIGGFVLPTIATGGTSLLGGAGAASARVGAAAARGAGRAAIQLGGKSAPSFVRRAGIEAADNAVQGALLQTGNEVHRMLVEDPEQTVSSALTNVGAATLLGGGLGAGMSVVGTAGSKALEQAGVNFKSLVNRAQTRAGVEVVEQQAKRAGVELSPAARGALSAEGKSTAELLKQSTSSSGDRIRKELLDVEEQAADAIVAATGRSKAELEGLEELSEYEIGQRLKDQVVKEVDEIVTPISKEFDEISDQFKTVSMPEAEREALGASLGRLAKEKYGLSPDSAAMKELQRIQRDLPNIKTLEDLRNYQSIARENITKAMGDKYSRLGGQVSSVFREAEERALTDVVGAQAPEMVGRLAAARAGYREAMGFLEDLDSRLRVGRYRSPGGFVRNLQDMTPEQLLQRTGRGRDAEFLKLLEQRLPGSRELVSNARVDKLLRDAYMAPGGLEGNINTRRFFRLYDKLTPEEKASMLGAEAVGRIDAARAILEELPKNINPSGTARAQEMLQRETVFGLSGLITGLLTGSLPAGLVAAGVLRVVGKEAPDAARLAMLRSLGSSADASISSLGRATKFIDNAIKGEQLMTRAAKNVIRTGVIETIPERLIPKPAQIEKLDQIVRKVAEADPLEMSAAIEGDMGPYLEREVGAVGLTMGRVAAYLNSQRPKEPKLGPLDPIAPASEAALNKYRRTLNIAQQPLIVMQHIKDGTLNLQDMRDIEAMYPELLGALRERVMLELTEAENQERQIPSRTVNALSLFLGVPLTASLKPQALMSNQAAISRPPEQSQQGPTKAQAQALDKISSNAATKSQSREQTRRTQ
jgi:hypothetical protein